MKKILQFSVVIIFLLSCSVKELGEIYIPEKTPYINQLVRKGVSVSLPNGFSFYLKKREIKNLITRFRSRKIEGEVERLIYKYPMSNRKLAFYYAEKILDGAAEKTIRKASGIRDIYFISAVSKNRKKELKCALYLKDKKDLLILQMRSEKGVLSKNKRIFVNSAVSLRRVNTKASIRKIKGIPSFSCKSNRYIWYGDLGNKKGYKVFKRKERIRITVYSNLKTVTDSYGSDFKTSYFKYKNLKKPFKIYHAESSKKYRIIFITVGKAGLKVRIPEKKKANITFNNDLAEDLLQCFSF